MFERREARPTRMAALYRLGKLHLVADQDHVPIITLVNKLDREGRDPFDLLDEIQQSVALDVTPSSWPLVLRRDHLDQ
jgi:peptide chain release factor 3